MFDRSHVIEGACDLLNDAGVMNGCSIVRGTSSRSRTGADTYLLSQIIHDWSDEPAIEILRNCQRAMGASGTLILVEHILDPTRPDPTTALLDLTMLTVLGSKERSAEEYRMLLAKAGFRLSRIIPTASPFCVIEAKLADVE